MWLGLFERFWCCGCSIQLLCYQRLVTFHLSSAQQQHSLAFLNSALFGLQIIKRPALAQIKKPRLSAKTIVRRVAIFPTVSIMEVEMMGGTMMNFNALTITSADACGNKKYKVVMKSEDVYFGNIRSIPTDIENNSCSRVDSGKIQSNPIDVKKIPSSSTLHTTSSTLIPPIEPSVANYSADSNASIHSQIQLHGKGKYQWKDGSCYEGEFRMNKITGKGEYRWFVATGKSGSIIDGCVG